MAYNPSNEGGQAVADIFSAIVNPSGKLPITYPRFDEPPLHLRHKMFSGRIGGEGRPWPHRNSSLDPA